MATVLMSITLLIVIITLWIHGDQIYELKEDLKDAEKTIAFLLDKPEGLKVPDLDAMREEATNEDYD